MESDLLAGKSFFQLLRQLLAAVREQGHDVLELEFAAIAVEDLELLHCAGPIGQHPTLVF